MAAVNGKPGASSKDTARIRAGTPPPNPWQNFSARNVPPWQTALLKPVNVKTGSRDYVSCVGWSCDGKRLASCGYEKAVRLWNPERTTDMHLTTTLAGAHDALVHHLAWHPSRAFLLVSISKADKQLSFWDVRHPQAPTSTLKTPRELQSVVWHPGGKELLALSGDDGLYLIRPRARGDVASVEPGPEAAGAGAGAGEGMQLGPGGGADGAGADTGAAANGASDGWEWEWEFGPRHDGWGQINDAAYDHTGGLLLLSKVSGTLELVRCPPAPAPSPSSSSFASSSSGAAAAGAGFNTWEKLPAHVNSCYAAALDPRGFYAATGGADALLNVFETREWVCVRTYDADMPVREIAFSHDGEYIATASDDVPGIDIWETETGLRTLRIPTPGPAATLAWHPGKYILASGGDGGAAARAGWCSFFGL